MTLPTLFSLRQCPYAMRARIGLLLAEQTVILRNIVMTNIPKEMFEFSAKGEVPVLVLDKNFVIDESLDIMIWALKKNDPNNLLYKQQKNISEEILSFIQYYDNHFVDVLKKYKAASRYHDEAETACRQQCEQFIKELEQRLTQHDYLFGETASLADFAILPFVRQFSRVDRRWFVSSPYPKLKNWLTRHYLNPVFSKAMKKYPLCSETKETILFPST